MMNSPSSAIIHEATKTYYDSLTNDYNGLYKDPISSGEDEIVTDFAKDFLHVDDNQKILDLGCGTGLGYEIIPAKHYVGIDISPHMISQAKKQFPKADFRIEDFDKIELPNDFFTDVVSFYGSLSHSTEIDSVINEIYDTLTPGGKFVLMFYSQYSVKNILSSIIHLNLELISHFRPYQIRNYSKNEPPPVPAYFYSAGKLRKMFTKFESVKIFGLNYLPEVPVIKNLFKVNKSFTKSLLAMEFKTVGKFFPSLGYSLIVTGIKPE